MKSNVNKARVLANLRANPDLVPSILIFAAALALYMRTMPPTVLDGDSGEYQYMAYILGVPHSTGYPLYILLGKLFTLLPLGDVAYRINLFSAVSAALAAPVVYWTARRVIPGRTPAALATLIFAVTPSMWGSAIEAKTYALHLLLGVLTVFLALRWHQDGRRSDFYWFAIVCGLDLTNHPTIRFIGPALLLVLWLNRARLDRAMLARGVLLGLVPLLLYAYIPIRANQLIAQQDPENFKLYSRSDAMVKGTVTAYYNNTAQGIWSLVSGLDNSYKVDVKSPLESASRVELSLALLLQQYGWVGISFALAGMWLSWHRDRKVFAILAAVAAGMGFIAFYLRGISTVFYFSMAYFILALWIGLGIAGLLDRAARFRARVSSGPVASLLSPFLVVPVLSLLPLSTLVTNFTRMDESQNYGPRNDAQAVLREDFPPNAVLSAPWEVSQPMRYYQFVENQRPDLLVMNVPPAGMAARQFNLILSNALKVGRPFYLVQFDPEFKTDPGPRSVEAIPLPLLQEPHPRYALQDAHITDEVQVLGCDLDPDPPQPGQPARLWIYYRATKRMYPMYSAYLTVTDLLGHSVGEYSGFPVSFDFPTYRWYELGEYYRDGWMIYLPLDAPSGLYHLDLAWYVYNLETRKSDYDRESNVALGSIRIGNLTTNVSTIANPKPARFGDAISFLGWDSVPAGRPDSFSVARGQALSLDLIWRADRAVSEGYTVFVHLVDASGRVVADADSPPSSGLFPTDRWTAGDNVRDRHILHLPADLSPGDYGIEIGMYVPATGTRLPVGTADKLLLGQLTVR